MCSSVILLADHVSYIAITAIWPWQCLNYTALFHVLHGVWRSVACADGANSDRKAKADACSSNWAATTTANMCRATIVGQRQLKTNFNWNGSEVWDRFPWIFPMAEWRESVCDHDDETMCFSAISWPLPMNRRPLTNGDNTGQHFKNCAVVGGCREWAGTPARKSGMRHRQTPYTFIQWSSRPRVTSRMRVRARGLWAKKRRSCPARVVGPTSMSMAYSIFL